MTCSLHSVEAHLLAPNAEDPSPEALETGVLDLEAQLGIRTSNDRLLEASLLIDLPLLLTAIITGHKNPERLFGTERWAGHLAARLYAKQHLKAPLTLDFIREIHRQLMLPIYPEHGGRIWDGSGEAYGGAFKDGKFVPLQLSERQFEGLAHNRFVQFARRGDDPQAGFVEYPPNIFGLFDHVLEHLCKRYNKDIAFASLPADKVWTIARFQRDLVSLHPMERDMNGATSRILMNWGLESNGMAPAIIWNPDDDLFSTEEGWAAQVGEGSLGYHAIATILKKGAQVSPAHLFCIEDLCAAYAQNPAVPAPALPEGQWYDIQESIDFLCSLQAMT